MEREKYDYFGQILMARGDWIMKFPACYRHNTYWEDPAVARGIFQLKKGAYVKSTSANGARKRFPRPAILSAHHCRHR